MKLFFFSKDKALNGKVKINLCQPVKIPWICTFQSESQVQWQVHSVWLWNGTDCVNLTCCLQTLLYHWPNLCPATHARSQPRSPVWSALFSQHCYLHLLLKIKPGTACLHEQKAQWNHGISTLLILAKHCIFIDKETEALLGFKSCSELLYID